MLELAQPKFEAAGVSDRIEVLVGSATDSINKLQKKGQRFDIAFLDADKTGYLGYYSQLMDNQLINPGGIIVVDNALMKVCHAIHCSLVLHFAFSGIRSLASGLTQPMHVHHLRHNQWPIALIK